MKLRFLKILSCVVLVTTIIGCTRRNSTESVPKITAQWNPSFRTNYVFLTVTNLDSKLIAISPNLGITSHSPPALIGAEPRTWYDKTVINPSVDFVIPTNASVELMRLTSHEEGTMEVPVTILPNQTKTIKLTMHGNRSQLADLSKEAAFCLKLGDAVISSSNLEQSVYLK